MRNRNKPKWNSLKQWNLALTNDETLAAGPCHCGPALHPWRLLPPPLKAPPPPGFQLGAQSFFGCHLPFSFPISSPPPPLPPSSFLLPCLPRHPLIRSFISFPRLRSLLSLLLLMPLMAILYRDSGPGFFTFQWLEISKNPQTSLRITKNQEKSRKIQRTLEKNQESRRILEESRRNF